MLRKAKVKTILKHDQPVHSVSFHDYSFIFFILISVNLTVNMATEKQLFRTNITTQPFKKMRNHWAMFQRSPPQLKRIKTNSPAFH